jgi:ribosomal protein S27AE
MGLWNCGICGTELIWGGDHDGEDYGDETYEIVSNLSCPKCEALVFVHHQKKDENET